MPKATTSAKYSTIARDFLGHEVHGFGFVPRDPKEPDPTWFTAKPKVVKVKGTDHLKPKTGRISRLIARGWRQHSDYMEGLGHRSYLLDAHGNVLAASPLALTKGDAKWWIKKRLDQLLQDWDEGR